MNDAQGAGETFLGPTVPDAGPPAGSRSLAARATDGGGPAGIGERAVGVALGLALVLAACGWNAPLDLPPAVDPEATATALVWASDEGAPATAQGTNAATPAAAQETGGEAGATTEARAPTPDALTALLRSQGPGRDPADLALRMGRAVGPLPTARAAPTATRQVGDTDLFWVHDIDHERYFQVPATLRVVTDDAYFWVQDGQEADDQDLDRGATAFSRSVVTPIRQVFGTEWRPGLDGDRRLHVLHHQPIAGVAGYFSSIDEYPSVVEPYSNQREMFYINNGIYTPGDFEYLSLLAHELQHMIHWYRDPAESVWVNEGLSELATSIAGYQHQFGDAFLSDPDTPLTEWQANPGTNAPHYAASFLFFAWLRARYGDEAIRAIVGSPASGPAGVEDGLARVGVAQSFDDAFLDWAVANLVDDTVRAAGYYSYGEDPINRVVPRELAPEGVEDTVGQYATDYFDATPYVRNGQLRLDFAGDGRVGLLEPVPAAPGRVWWSGRGDNRDSRLTQRFDLTGATDATLQLRMWRDLEENWDYAYLQASADEGATWQRLDLPGATDANPNGNNYGRGITGGSDGWEEVAVSLAAYVGQPLWLRFEVVTDDAVSLSGLALDDIRLEAAGLADDAETDAGWQAEGWVRLNPDLPQRWGVQAIVAHDAGIDVHRLPVGADGTATIALDDIPPDGSVTLAVSGLTPGTRHRAGYRLQP